MVADSVEEDKLLPLGDRQRTKDEGIQQAARDGDDTYPKRQGKHDSQREARAAAKLSPSVTKVVPGRLHGYSALSARIG